MTKYEDGCVGCPPEMGCLGSACPYRDIKIHICDICEYNEAAFEINGVEYCEDCAKEYLEKEFANLNVIDQAELLEVDWRRLSLIPTGKPVGFPAEIFMTNQELLDAGYKRWDPSPYEDCVTDMFQKCITDEYGKRYFITIKRWDFTRFPRGSVGYEAESQFTLKNDNTTDITCLNGWSIEEIEKYYADLWDTGWFKYYEAFFGHESDVEAQY